MKQGLTVTTAILRPAALESEPGRECVDWAVLPWCSPLTTRPQPTCSDQPPSKSLELCNTESLPRGSSVVSGRARRLVLVQSHISTQQIQRSVKHYQCWVPSSRSAAPSHQYLLHNTSSTHQTPHLQDHNQTKTQGLTVSVFIVEFWTVGPDRKEIVLLQWMCDIGFALMTFDIDIFLILICM